MDYSDYIAKALTTPGGHLSIGRGGATLHYAHSDYGTRATASMSGMVPDTIKPLAIAAGLPVIDSRTVAETDIWEVAVRGPMVAVDRDPDPAPYHGLSYAPLAYVAAAYQRAGAEVYNVAGLPALAGETAP